MVSKRVSQHYVSSDTLLCFRSVLLYQFFYKLCRLHWCIRFRLDVHYSGLLGRAYFSGFLLMGQVGPTLPFPLLSPSIPYPPHPPFPSLFPSLFPTLSQHPFPPLPPPLPHPLPSSHPLPPPNSSPPLRSRAPLIQLGVWGSSAPA